LLDSMQIEIGALGGGIKTVDYASNLSGATKKRSVEGGKHEKRLFFSPTDKQSELWTRQLLGKADIQTQGRVILHFYSTKAEDLLAEAENRALQKANKRLDEVRPAFPEMLGTPSISTTPSITPVALAEKQSPGRRRALADWLGAPQNPLTARVFVNRLWQHHLGRGIVATPNDFGAMGAAASHPQLLDWLTAELIDSGWSIKHVHRLILLSATYQQQSEEREGAARVDSENKYLWRANRRRMDAEVIRDTVLQVSGQLNLEAGGPAVRLPLHPEIARLQYKGTWYPHPVASQHLRRSVYVFVKRNNRPPLLENFDSPSTLASCGERTVSTHAGQALSMINSSFLQRQSLMLARRLESGQAPAAAIREVYQLALSRLPTRQELRLGQQYLLEQEQLIAEEQMASGKPVKECSLLALAEYCQVILNLDEFLYVE